MTESKVLKEIKFYSNSEKYKEFSNMFIVKNLIIDGIKYKSVEHYLCLSLC